MAFKLLVCVFATAMVASLASAALPTHQDRAYYCETYEGCDRGTSDDVDGTSDDSRSGSDDVDGTSTGSSDTSSGPDDTSTDY